MLEAAAEAAPIAQPKRFMRERHTRASSISGGVAQTPIFFAVGRNGIGELLREMEKKSLFFFWSATAARNNVLEYPPAHFANFARQSVV